MWGWPIFGQEMMAVQCLQPDPKTLECGFQGFAVRLQSVCLAQEAQGFVAFAHEPEYLTQVGRDFSICTQVHCFAQKAHGFRGVSEAKLHPSQAVENVGIVRQKTEGFFDLFLGFGQTLIAVGQ